MPTPESRSDPAPAERPTRAFLRAHIDGRRSAPDAVVEALVERIRARHGETVQAILGYGSYLRGKRDTVLDFYVVLDDYRSLPVWQRALARALPPNVYQIAVPLADGTVARGKYAVLTPARLLRGSRREFHSYYWARFAQPCRLLHGRDKTAMETVLDALEAAPRRFVRLVLPRLPESFDGRLLWTTGLRLTYRCELRSEKPGQAEALFEASRDHFETLTRLLADDGLGFAEQTDSGSQGRFRRAPTSVAAKLASRLNWRLRAMQGKLLSVARVAKAATTFEAPLEYLLWKIERHSGIRVQASPRQLRHPLLFAWPLLWRLYRRGAFK